MFDWKKIIQAVKRPEFKWFWLFCLLLVAAFGESVFFLPADFLLIQGLLLAAACVFIFSMVYKANQTERGGNIEKSELKAILFGMDSSLVVYDTDFNALFFNPAAEKLFKLNAGEVLGHQFRPQDVENPSWRLIGQIIFPSLAPSIVSVSKVGEYPQVVDLSFTDPSLELRISTMPLSDERGKLFGFMKVIRDRTRELYLLKSKSEFLTVASHQLRTPVTDINWALTSLSEDKSLSEQSRIALEGALAAGQGLLKVVEDLLNVAKIEEGRSGYKFEKMDLAEFISGELSKITASARRAGVKLYFDKPKTALPQVMIDPEKLARAFDNILENAVRYNVENGEILVKIEPEEGGAFLDVSVKDSGIGIPKADLPKLFTKFFRADNATKTKTEGTGLGLYIAKNIVQSHGGKIWAESEAQRGSIFHIALPTDPTLVPQHEVALGE